MTDTHTTRPVRIGIGGPVGSGKTMLLLRLIEKLNQRYKLVAITNDIYTKEDEQFLVKNSPLEARLSTFTKRICVLEITATSTVPATKVYLTASGIPSM